MPHFQLDDVIDGLPNICGSEALLDQAMARPESRATPLGAIDFQRAQSAFAIALHMH